MKLRRREKQFKECPRCGLKCLFNADSCPECGLVFSRLEIATNADAKAKIKRREKEYILRTSTLPTDVSFMKLLLLCIFGGLFGAHSFYVGRYWRGIIPLISTTILIFFVVFNNEMIAIDGTGQTLGMISTLLGFTMMLWPIDIVLILMKKFKVPVAIDLDKNVQADKEKRTGAKTTDNQDNIRQEVLDDVNVLKNENKNDTHKEEKKE
ncbi:MAG: TM2 domain-containing protein [Clostridia bacterium]|nr:TM2 domain-containing protein [Clostridia bacterium]